jgi:hypothetical protein
MPVCFAARVGGRSHGVTAAARIGTYIGAMLIGLFGWNLAACVLPANAPAKS